LIAKRTSFEFNCSQDIKNIYFFSYFKVLKTQQKEPSKDPTSPWVGIRNISDHSPFGVLLAERTVEGEFFRNGFQGQERDDEVKGDGNFNSTFLRIFDSRIGRWTNTDPLGSLRPWMSPYNFVQNTPLNKIDPLGGVDDWVKGNGENDTGHGENDWHWVEEIHSQADADQAGYSGYASPGTILEAARIAGNSKVGSIQLLDNGQAAYFMEEMNVSELKTSNPASTYSLSYNLSSEMVPSDGYNVANISELRSNWIYYDDFCGYVNNLAIGVTLAASTAVLAPISTPSALASGTINSSVNLGAQLLVTNGDFNNIDLFSIAISFGSGYLPGSSTVDLIRNSVISGGADALFDFTNEEGKKSIFFSNKSFSSTLSDFGFNSIGNLGGSSFGKNPFLFEVVGTTITTFPTTTLNNIVNDKLKKK
jgi:RHS repeat-associated protein